MMDVKRQREKRESPRQHHRPSDDWGGGVSQVHSVGTGDWDWGLLKNETRVRVGAG